MRTASVTQRATALLLCLVLISCGTTRYSVEGPTGSLDLARYVLSIEPTPDGQETYTWRPLEDFALTRRQSQNRMVAAGGLVRTSLGGNQIGDICYRVWELCDEECRGNPLPPEESHYIASFGGNEMLALDKYCEYRCRREENECRAKLRREAQDGHVFDSVDDALDWLKRHKAEIATGGVIVIAGVVFVAIVCGGGGCLLLAPLVLVVSTDIPTAYIAEACR